MQRRDFLRFGSLAAAGILLLSAHAVAKDVGVCPRPVINPAAHGSPAITALLTPCTSALRANYLNATLSRAFTEPTVNWIASISGADMFVQITDEKTLGQFGQLRASGNTLSFWYKGATHNVTLNPLEA